MTEDDSQTCFVLAHVPSKEAMDKFFENAGEEVSSQDILLESTEVTMLTNQPPLEKATTRTHEEYGRGSFFVGNTVNNVENQLF